MALIKTLQLNDSDLALIDSAFGAYLEDCRRFRDEGGEEGDEFTVTTWTQTIEDVQQLQERMGDAEAIHYDANGRV